MTRRLGVLGVVLVVSVLLLVTTAGSGHGQESYPNRPITIVVPYPPGGLADLTARPLAAAMERLLKNPVVVMNKAGAAGAVGTQSVAIAKPDGYTLLLSLVSISTQPEVDALFGRPTTFTRDQFVGIARLNADPCVVFVGSDKPWKTFGDLVDDAKRRPGEIVFTSSGLYGPTHIPTEMLMHVTGTRMRHLPTAGGGPAMNALLGGHAHLFFTVPALAAPHLKAGKLRALAVSSPTRLPQMPDVPTLRELGYDVEYYAWAGLFAPKGVPAAALKTLRAVTRQAALEPNFKNAMAKVDAVVAYQDADEFNAWWDKDARTLAAVIKRIGRVESK